MSFDDASSFSRQRLDSKEYIVIDAPEDGASVIIPYSDFLFSADFDRDGFDLILSGADGKNVLIKDYFLNSEPASLETNEGAGLSGKVVQVLAGPDRAGEYAQQGQTEGATPIGQVETLDGSATVQRADGTVEPLQVGTKVFQNDVVQTADGSTLSITFADSTIFTLSAASRMVLSELVYAPEGENNSSLFNLVQGSFVFVAGEVAKTGDMNVQTPVATMGIRGTTVKVDIQTDANGQSTVSVSLNRDIDGSIGSIVLTNNLDGSVTTITTVESNWVISPADGTTTEVPRTVSEFSSDQVIIEAAYQAFRSLQNRQDAGEQAVELDDAGEGEPSSDEGESDGEGDDEGEGEESGEGDDAGDEGNEEGGEGENSGEESGNDGDSSGNEGGNEGQSSGDEGTGESAPSQQGSTGGGFGDASPTDTTDGSDGLAGTQISGLEGASAETSGGSTGDSSGGNTVTDFENSGPTSDPDPDPDPVPFSPPVITIKLWDPPGAINEDTSVVLNGFEVSASSGGDIDLLLTAGSTISLAPGANVTIDFSASVETPPGSGQFELLRISGTAEELNNALNGAIYTPSLNEDVEGTLRVDGPNDAVVVIVNSDPTLKVQIDALDDPPTLDAGAMSVDEDGPAVTLDLSELGNDPDTGEDGSTLTYTTNLTSEFFANGVSIAGTSLTFDPSGNFESLSAGETQDVTISVTATDGSGATATNDITVTVMGENDAPSGFDNEAGDVPIQERADGAANENTGTITQRSFQLAFDDVDTDGTPPTFAAIGDAGNDAAFEALVTFAFNHSPGSPAGSRDMVEVQATVNAADLDSLQGGQTVTLNYVLQITDSDGGVTPLNNSTLEFQVRLVGSNDGPTIEIAAAGELGNDLLTNGGFETGPEGPSGLTTVTAGDSTTIPGWTVSSGDVDFITENSGFGAPEGDHVVDLNGNTPGDIEQTISTVAGSTYFVSFLLSGDPFDGETVKDVRVSAAGTSQDFSFTNSTSATRANLESVSHSFSFVATGSSTTINFQSLDLTDNNSGPYLDAVEVRQVNVVTDEDTAITLPAITVGDVDATSLEILLSSSDGGTFVFAASADLTGITNITGLGTDTFGFEGSVSDLNRVLMSIEFLPAQNFNGLEQIDLTVSDEALQIANEAIVVGVTAQNDTPVNTVPASFTVTEDVKQTLSGISVADPDAGNENITVTFSVNNGVLQVATDVSTGVPNGQISGNQSSSVTLTGTVDQINTTLANFEGLTYTGNQDFNGNDTLTINTNDNGATGAVGPLSDVDTVPITVTPVDDPLAITNVGQKITALVPGNGEQFAANIDMNDSGEIVSGSPLADPIVGNDGLGYLFVPGVNGQLGAPSQLNSPVESANDFFGSDSAINNSGVMAISAPGDTNNRGAIIVFTPDGSGGFTTQTLQAATPVDSDFLGISVDINASGVVAAAANGDDTEATGAGGLYIFRPNGSGGYLPAIEKFVTGAGAGDNLGDDLSINDSGVIVVGANLGDGLVANTGTAYVFRPGAGDDYTSAGEKLEATDGANGDNFGFATAINSNGTIAVGAPDAGSGAVYIFEEAVGNYSQSQKVTVDGIDPLSDFGASVDINQSGILVVGAPANTVNSSDNGSVYVFTPDGGGNYTSAPIKLYAPDGASGDNFGASVSINANGDIVVGADNDNIGAGAAYTFIRDANGNYIHDGNIFIPEGDHGDFALVTFDLNDLVNFSDPEAVPSIDANSISIDDSSNSLYDFSRAVSVEGTQVTVEISVFDILNNDDLGLVDITFDVVAGAETVSHTITINAGAITDNAINLIDDTTVPGTTTGNDGTITGTEDDDVIAGFGSDPNSFIGDQILAEDGDDLLVGGDIGSELLDGGEGDDLIFPGNSNTDNGDYIAGSLGNDRINFNAINSGFYDVFYSNLNASFLAIVATIDFATNTGIVQKVDIANPTTVVGTDTFVHLKNAFDANGGGLIMRGTTGDDTFTINAGSGNFFGIVAGQGNDVFNLESGIIRLEFRLEGTAGDPFGNGANQAVNVNLGSANNQVTNDGFGFTDDINFIGDFSSGSGNRVEIRGTDFSDTLIGGPGDDRFIGEQGDDFIDGAGGVDLIRFDRSGVASIEADLETETATGFWDDTIINYTVRNVEDIRGSNLGVDFLFGSSSGVTNGANNIDGRRGIDVIDGQGGDDTLTGGSDNNVFVIGTNNGSDTITDFVIGKDRISIIDNGLTDTTDFASFTFDGTDTLIGLGAGNMLTVSGVDLVNAADPEDSFLFNEINPDASGILTGNSQNSFLNGFSDDEVFNGGDGNETFLTGGASSGYFSDGDRVNAGAGDDLVITETGLSVVIGGPGDDRIQAAQIVYVSDSLNWGDGTWVSYATSTSAITVNYTSTAQSGLGAYQVADGLGGTDTLGGIDSILDSAFDDVFLVDGNDVTMRGGTGPRISLSAGNDTVTFFGNGGQIDYSRAGDAVDANLATGSATDRNIESAADEIGNDTFVGANRLLGSAFDDILTGDTNDNRFRGRAGDDIINGGGGRNRIDFFDTTNRVVVDLEDSDGNGFEVDDDGHGDRDQLSNIQVVSANFGSDILQGDANDNSLFGYAGNDLLNGKAGADFLEGDSGNIGLRTDGTLRGGDDFLQGGLGDDNLRGGVDADVFFIANGDGFDFIDDFNFAEGDRIDVSDFGFSDSSSFSATYNATFDSTFFDFIGTGISVRGDLTGLTSTELDERFIFSVQEGSVAANDDFFGTAGNDYFRPLDGDEFNSINSSGGNDTIDYVFAFTAAQSINYSGNANAITFDVNGLDNTASVNKGGGEIDTIRNIFNPLNSGFFSSIGGFSIRGTNMNDTFNINTQQETWMAARGGDGVDSYNIQNDDGGLVRIDLRGGSTAIQVNLSLSTGQIINDGFNNTETITGPGKIWEVRGDVLNDNFLGSVNDESFITSGGNDFVDGGDGFDRVRYDRSEFDTGIIADLNNSIGTVTGTFNTGGGSTAFSDDLINIEWIRGTSNADTITGTTDAERFQGRGSGDTIFGGGGADRLQGEDGNDSILVPDLAFQQVDGGDGLDSLSILDGTQVLDFTVLDNGEISSIETLNLIDATQTVQITIDELNIIGFSETFNPVINSFDDDPVGSSGTRLADSDDALVIAGDGDDIVNLARSGDNAGFSWQLAGNDNSFNVYNFSDASTTIASVAIDDDVAVNIVA